MNSTARPIQPSGHFHAVQFYDGPDALCRIVGDFLTEGIAKHEPAVVIATPAHAARIADCLRERSVDVESLKRLGDLVILDARETLYQFMVDGMPNHQAFQDVVGGVIERVRRDHGGVAVRAYGEMVDLLWRDGLEAAAIRLETLWNQLAASHKFSLMCGYSMGNFYKGTAMDDIRGQHSHLVSDGGDSIPLAS
jgi:hypothetical protein